MKFRKVYKLLIGRIETVYIDGLVQEKYNLIANSLELRISCANPSILYCLDNETSYDMKQSKVQMYMYCITKLYAIYFLTHWGRDKMAAIFQTTFSSVFSWMSIKISLKIVPKGPINNNPALVQIMAWRRSGDKPLSDPMMVSLLTHICVTRPQWVEPNLSRCCTVFVFIAKTIASYLKHHDDKVYIYFQLHIYTSLDSDPSERSLRKVWINKTFSVDDTVEK